MSFLMNECDIRDAANLWDGHKVLEPLTLTLLNLLDATNVHSDGWAYWPKPSRASRKLQELIQSARTREARDAITPELIAAALRPVKAFRTRSGIDFDIYESFGVLYIAPGVLIQV
jgi:hypothetical protein